MAKRFLFLFRQTPSTGLRARETLDMALTIAAFDQPVSLLFMDDGVYQLLPNPSGSEGASVMADWLGALPLYGVESVWVESASLLQRGMSRLETVIPVRTIARAAVAELIAAHDVVMAD